MLPRLEGEAAAATRPLVPGAHGFCGGFLANENSRSQLDDHAPKQVGPFDTRVPHFLPTANHSPWSKKRQSSFSVTQAYRYLLIASRFIAVNRPRTFTRLRYTLEPRRVVGSQRPRIGRPPPQPIHRGEGGHVLLLADFILRMAHASNTQLSFCQGTRLTARRPKYTAAGRSPRQNPAHPCCIKN